MASICSNCKTEYSNDQQKCAKCGHICFIQNFRMGKQSEKYHTKKNSSDPTQGAVKGQKRGGQPAKMEIKTQRQSATLARHKTRLNQGESEVINSYTSGGGKKVQVHMLKSQRAGNAPSFYGASPDGTFFPIDPTSEYISEEYRYKTSHYDSDSEDEL